jgi:hypothetical protein
MKTPARRKRQDTPVLERLVSKITVMDSDHALFGLSLRLISLCAAKGRSHQIVELPDGRHLTLRRPSSGLAQWYRSRAGGGRQAGARQTHVRRIGTKLLIAIRRVGCVLAGHSGKAANVL